MQAVDDNKLVCTEQNLSVPKLRFDFNEQWSSFDLGNILKIGSGRDYKHLDSGIYSVYGTGGFMKKVNDYLFDGESVCIGRKGTIDKPIFLNEKFWTVDTLFYTYDFVNAIPKFVYLIFQIINWQKYNEASGVPSLSKSTIEKIKVKIPSLPEQQKIASFLSSVDEKLQQLNKKKNLLEDYKKGVMQKIFSQELRFKPALSEAEGIGNNYPDWEEKKLGEVFENIGGTALENHFSDNGSHSVISIGNYGVDGKYNDNGQRIVLNEKTQTKLLEKDNLVMVLNDKTKTGDIIGSTILIEKNDKYIYNQRSERLICDTSILSPLYAWTFLNSKKFRRLIFSISQGGTQIYVNFSAVKKLSFPIPCIEEQQKIANFLSAIDEKITLTNIQIDNTKAFKKGLLQQMFV